MKKTLQIAMMGLIAVPAFAQYETEPLVIDGFYAQRVSPNGRYVGSMADEMKVLDLVTGKSYGIEGSYLGLGNAVSDNGFAVGFDGNQSIILRPDGSFIPDCLLTYAFSSFNAITPDGSRACGFVGQGIEGIVPFYVDLDEAGNAGELHVLPNPEVDLNGAPPTYTIACAISADGKSIIGETVDYGGGITMPVIFTEDEEGNWSYEILGKQYYNPEHIEIPANPFLDEPRVPEFVDYMDPESRIYYEEEYDAWIMGMGPYPDPFEFMSDEQYQQYVDAVDEYNAWVDRVVKEIPAYLEAYQQLVKTTVSYGLNDIVISPDGATVYVPGSIETDSSDLYPASQIYAFNIATGDRTEVSGAPRNVYPSQVLPDGTIVFATPMTAGASTYLLLPDSETAISINDYYSSTHPAYLNWMDANIYQSGLVNISDNYSTFAAGLQYFQYLKEYDYYYSTYIYTSYGSSGVEGVGVESEDGLYRVYNIQGVNVLTTTDASAINDLNPGLYIVNGRKVLVK